MSAMRFIGLDLAWGERRPDGVCAIALDDGGARVLDCGLRHGDAALLDYIDNHAGAHGALLLFDAPLVCPNLTGARPVDRLTHRVFHREKCGCHPTNATRCPRPLRLAESVFARGYAYDWSLDSPDPRLALEVYPHPALVRWFDLPERIPYKRGPVVARRAAFAELQRRLRDCLAREFPALELDAGCIGLLEAVWTKDVEDQLDALICALIGYWHWLHRGARSQVLGDRATGFLLVPRTDPGEPAR